MRLNLLLYYWDIKKKTIGDLFKARVDKHPEKICFYFEESQWTFKEVYYLY